MNHTSGRAITNEEHTVKNGRKDTKEKNIFFLYSSGRPLVLLSWPEPRKKKKGRGDSAGAENLFPES